METIIKKICLDDFRSHHIGKMPVIEGADKERDYFFIPKDVVIPESDPLYDIKDKLPLVKNPSNQLVLRYRQMVHIYDRLIKLIRNGNFYRYCRRRDGNTWRLIDDYGENVDKQTYFFTTDVSFQITTGFLYSGVEIGTVIFVTDDAEWFNSTFRIDSRPLDRQFRVMSEGLYDGTRIDQYTYATPFANIPLYIDEEFDDEGVFESVCEEWIPNKKYYLGDVVFYDKNDGRGPIAYKLINCNKVDYIEYEDNAVRRAIWPSNDIYIGTEEAFESFKKTYFGANSTVYRYVRVGSNKYYIGKPCYTGTVKNGITYFEDEDVERWQSCSVDTMKRNTPSTVSSTTMSKLVSLKERQVAQDKNNVVLPFYVNKNGDTETYLEYTCGVYNVKPSDVVTGDYLYKIEVLDDDYDVVKTYTYEPNISLNVSDPSDRRIKVTANAFPNSGYLRFTYYLNAKVTVPVDFTDNGIKYIETHSFEKKKKYCEYIDAAKYVWREIPLMTMKDLYGEPVDNVTYYPDVVEGRAYDNISQDKIQLYTGSLVLSASSDNVGKIAVCTEMDCVSFYKCLAEFTYIDIEMEEDTNDDLESKDLSTTMSTVEITKQQISNDTLMNVPIIKYDDVMGLISDRKSLDINIERGVSAAFERHNILSEVNTFEDLQNYRNDYFKLGSKKTN